MNSTSKRKIKVTVNGKAYTVEVGSLSESPLTVNVNGQPYIVDISMAEIEKVSTDQSAAALESVARSISPAPPTPAAAPPAAAGSNAITAPMPGSIVEVMVRPGDEVQVGEQICILEAMKMKNAIRSPRTGVVLEVPVSPGQKVAHGEVLVTFE
jgi:biotin carboxyl carrier protein